MPQSFFWIPRLLLNAHTGEGRLGCTLCPPAAHKGTSSLWVPCERHSYEPLSGKCSAWVPSTQLVLPQFHSAEVCMLPTTWEAWRVTLQRQLSFWAGKAWLTPAKAFSPSPASRSCQHPSNSSWIKMHSQWLKMMLVLPQYQQRYWRYHSVANPIQWKVRNDYHINQLPWNQVLAFLLLHALPKSISSQFISKAPKNNGALKILQAIFWQAPIKSWIDNRYRDVS